MGTIRNLQIVLNYPKDPFLNLATPKNTCQILIPRKILELNFSFFFLRGGGGDHFGLKTGIHFAYRAWFARELRECMNVIIIS